MSGQETFKVIEKINEKFDTRGGLSISRVYQYVYEPAIKVFAELDGLYTGYLEGVDYGHKLPNFRHEKNADVVIFSEDGECLGFVGVNDSLDILKTCHAIASHVATQAIAGHSEIIKSIPKKLFSEKPFIKFFIEAEIKAQSMVGQEELLVSAERTPIMTSEEINEQFVKTNQNVKKSLKVLAETAVSSVKQVNKERKTQGKSVKEKSAKVSETIKK